MAPMTNEMVGTARCAVPARAKAGGTSAAGRTTRAALMRRRADAVLTKN